LVKTNLLFFMKRLLIFFSFIISFQLNAQNSEQMFAITVKDSETKKTIQDVTVLVLKTKQNALTNGEGNVSINLIGVSSIQFSHPLYNKQIIRSTVLKPGENTVLIKKTIGELDEIIISRKHPQKILKALIDNSSEKLTVPGRLKVYSREFFKLNGSYNFYNDGIINFQLSGKPKGYETKILVEQNRSLGVLDEETTADLLGYNLNNIMENYYDFKYLNPLMISSAKKDYDFLIRVYAPNKDYYIMTAIPNSENTNLLDDFSIVYDHKKKLIIEVNTIISPLSLANVDKTSIFSSKKIYKSIFKSIYRLDDNNDYYLLSSKEEIGFEKKTDKTVKEIEVRNYMFTSNFSTKTYSFKEDEVFKDKSLHNKKNLILSNFWETSGLNATAEEQEIINIISEKTDIPE
jgi:hypothetical protein